MPVVKITQDDINRSKQPDAGWHLMRVEKLTESDSSKKDSKNWTFDCVILRSQAGSHNAGRFGYARFNSKAPGMLIPFISALTDSNDIGPTEVDLNDLVGKEFWGRIDDDVYDGKIQKRLNEYATASDVPF